MFHRLKALFTFTCVATLLIVISLGVPVNAQQSPRDASACIQVFERTVGKSCNKPNSHAFRVRNTCSEPIDMRYCLKSSKGMWNCEMYSGASSGKQTGTSICEGTGEIWTGAKWTGDKSRTPHPDDGLLFITGKDSSTVCEKLEGTPGTSGACNCIDLTKNGNVKCSMKHETSKNLPDKSGLKDSLNLHIEQKHKARCEKNALDSECRSKVNGGSGVRG
ncbi:MAG: hypothetical protein Q7T70_10330 [Polaromonas sp.]|nr:hypothetical protein [Polaromonas sp.]